MRFGQDFLQTILQSVADGIVACDENGRLVLFNPATEKIIGLPLEPITPENWANYYSLYYPDGSGLMRREDIPLFKALQGDNVENAEMLIKSQNGDKYVLSSGRQITDANGKVLGAVVSMHDITQIKKAQHELESARHFSQKISDVTPALVTVFNVNTGEYLYVNNTAQAMLGYSPQLFIEKGFGFMITLMHPDDSARILEQNQKAIEKANDDFPNYNDNQILEFEYRVKHKDGSYRWLHTYSIVFSRDENHRLEQAINISVDITERKKTEDANQQLRISEDYFRDLADQSPFMIWKVGVDGLCSYVNKRWSDFTGLSFEQSLGLGWGAAFHPEDTEKEYEKFMDCFHKRIPYTSKFRIRSNTGEHRWVLAQSNPLSQEGKGYIGSLTDITEQEQAQQATKLLMQQKDEFMSIASHELKTPITSMKAALQIVERLSAKNMEQNGIHNFVIKANKQIDKLTHLVEDLLDVTKIHAGKMRFNMAEFAVHEVIQDSLDQVRFNLSNHQLLLEGDTSACVVADKERIEQVLTNFLSNAIKYSPQGKKIILKTERDDEKLTISVTDYGIGIAEDKLPYIFDRFFRVQESQKFSGLGLGLYISNEIVVRHGGKIGVESVENQGSTFWFSIPSGSVTEET
ncbi:MAG: domain S-box protein [Sphingobacteriaceae bacterium]|jgi:two-component system CheB/CheR fusion protein|nr:domain S-box protein [Sphingobacteriaceae bacterium]